jgi:hypothetical protein
MSRRPASVTQADVARILRAAKQVGASEVEVRVGDSIIVVRMSDPQPILQRESVL